MGAENMALCWERPRHETQVRLVKGLWKKRWVVERKEQVAHNLEDTQTPHFGGKGGNEIGK